MLKELIQLNIQKQPNSKKKKKKQKHTRRYIEQIGHYQKEREKWVNCVVRDGNYAFPADYADVLRS